MIRLMTCLPITPTILAAALPWMIQPALGQDDVFPTVKSAESQEYGTYLTDYDGRPLYMFEADTQGTTASPAVSACDAECAEAWPPLEPRDDTAAAQAGANPAAGEVGGPVAGDQLNAAMLDTIEREDGSQQVTYNGWPLYYFVQDPMPEDRRQGQPNVPPQVDIEPTGHGKDGFGGGWYLVTPEGTAVEGAA